MYTPKSNRPKIAPAEEAYDREKIASLQTHPGWQELKKFLAIKTGAAIRKCLSPDIKRVEDLHDLGFYQGVIKSYEWVGDLVEAKNPGSKK